MSTVEPRISAVFARMDDPQAHTLERFVATDGYEGLRAALAMTPEQVQASVTASTLTGRGGAVDYLTHPGRDLPAEVTPQRFEVVVNLLSLATRARVRVRCQVPAAEPVLPSITDVYAGADAAEREVYDMFGVRFEGHPDLTRILMPEDWEGHPLRKDYGIGRIPVQFKAAPGPR